MLPDSEEVLMMRIAQMNYSQEVNYSKTSQNNELQNQSSEGVLLKRCS